MQDTTTKKHLTFDADFCAKVFPRDLENLGWDFTTGHEREDELVSPDRLKWSNGDYIKIWANDAGRMFYAVVLDGLEGDTMECDTPAAKVDMEILFERGRLWLW